MKSLCTRMLPAWVERQGGDSGDRPQSAEGEREAQEKEGTSPRSQGVLQGPQVRLGLLCPGLSSSSS